MTPKSLRISALFGLAAALVGCAGAPASDDLAVTRSPIEGDTVSIAGTPVAIRHTGVGDPHEEAGVAVAGGCPCERWGDEDDRDIFRGCARRKAKVALVPLDPATTFRFDSVAELKAMIRDDWVMDDQVMRNLSPPLTCDPTKGRRAREQRNVVVKAFLYAASKEDDNDFHVMIGDEDCTTGNCYINVEISGMPPTSSASFDALEDARIGFLELLGGEEPGTKYVEFEPFPVTVSGSSFFDVDHAAGSVGAPCCKPDTAWEIHPVRTFEARLH